MTRLTKFKKIRLKMCLFFTMFFTTFLLTNAQTEKMSKNVINKNHFHEKEKVEHEILNQHHEKQHQNNEHETHEHETNEHETHGHGHNHDNYKKSFVSVHGIMLFQTMNFLEKEERFENEKGNPEKWNSTASIPMFSIAMGYKFSKKTNILAKVEFEYGGLGGHQHLHKHGEKAHIGLEKSGAVTIERIYLTHNFSEHFKLRLGHMPVPMGQIYLAHEPTTYMASISGKADSKIIPREWQETGVSIFGKLSDKLNYNLMAVTGLDADYFEPHNFVSNGKQNRFEKIYFSSPALIGRIDYNINKIKLGLVGYWGQTDRNAQDQAHSGRNINVGLLEFDTKYRTNKWHVLGNVITGNVTNTEKLDKPIAQSALSGSVELGFNLNHRKNIFKNSENAFWLFGRLDYSNPMLNMPKGYDSDIRTKEMSISGGVNLFINKSVALKADYEYILVGNSSINNEHILSLSAAFSFLPYKK